MDAFLLGNVTDVDPMAPADPEINARLYIAPGGWVLVSARWNGSIPTATATSLALPLAIPADVAAAVEIDAYTLEMTLSTVPAGARQLAVHGGFSAVYLRRKGGLRLLSVSPAGVIVLGPGNSTSLNLTAFDAGNRTGITITVSAPGLYASTTQLRLPATLTLTVAPNTTAGYHRVTLTGEGMLPTVRWVQVVCDASYSWTGSGVRCAADNESPGPPLKALRDCPPVAALTLPAGCQPWWTDALVAHAGGSCTQRLPDRWWCHQTGSRPT